MLFAPSSNIAAKLVIFCRNANKKLLFIVLLQPIFESYEQIP